VEQRRAHRDDGKRMFNLTNGWGREARAFWPTPIAPTTNAASLSSAAGNLSISKTSVSTRPREFWPGDFPYNSSGPSAANPIREPDRILPPSNHPKTPTVGVFRKACGHRLQKSICNLLNGKRYETLGINPDGSASIAIFGKELEAGGEANAPRTILGPHPLGFGSSTGYGCPG